MRLKNSWLLLALLLTGACASRGPAYSRLEGDELFQYAMDQLEERDWSEAAGALDMFVVTYLDHPRHAEARYRLGLAYMGQEEYVTAAMEFDRLAVEFPLGPWADESRYQVCVAYAELSPPPPLDQEYTQNSIDHCESLIAYYPDSEFLPQAQEIVDRLTSRLAEKEYLTAEHYFRRNAFDSSIIYYQALADRYPTTPWAPRALLRLVQAYGRLNYDEEAEAAKARLLQEFPESPEARQVDGAATDIGS